MKTIETGLTFGMVLDLIRGSVKKLGMRLPCWKEDVIVVVKENEGVEYLSIILNRTYHVFYPNQEEMFSKEWEIVELEKEEE